MIEAMNGRRALLRISKSSVYALVRAERLGPAVSVYVRGYCSLVKVQWRDHDRTRIFPFVEEFAPDQLISFARQAETAAFTFALISDHYHPWTNQQPHSAFVWSTIGGISQVVDKLQLGTA